MVLTLQHIQLGNSLSGNVYIYVYVYAYVYVYFYVYVYVYISIFRDELTESNTLTEPVRRIFQLSPIGGAVSATNQVENFKYLK